MTESEEEEAGAGLGDCGGAGAGVVVLMLAAGFVWVVLGETSSVGTRTFNLRPSL